MVAAALAFLVLAAAPPVPHSPVSTGPAERGLATWMPGEVRCDGGAAVGKPIRRPLGTIGWRGSNSRQSVTLRFDIDGSGRPISITREDLRYVPNDDIAPSLAASRFPAKARSACSVTYTAQIEPFAAAPVADLVSYSVTPLSGRLPQQGWDRIQEAGNCGQAPRPQPLMRAYPDFDKLPATPGVRDWSMIAYDTDASGKPLNVRVQTGTGNKALDQASVKAVQESRFTGGARTGCSYPYWRAPEVMAAPPMPDKNAFKSGETCSTGREWTTAPVLRFPAAYNRRRIEGWAVVRYDVAPWGAVGNASVLAAEPSDDFGRQAVQMIQSAKAAASQEGSNGCVDRVRFVIKPDVAGADTDNAQPIVTGD
ncbi:energy transducer TonB [Novosphingobium resinovorum]|uniref:Energy transducer TonB n=1 Tax=Novosphingobium resinovorum TaxID=158500 RepID=A0A1D8A0A1_9SPHN|nr:energy transducer TonB [Novosphingobium resinovorum]AOR75547.1 energy transducer TonB [Novosphingobium resinovorum]